MKGTMTNVVFFVLIIRSIGYIQADVVYSQPLKSCEHNIGRCFPGYVKCAENDIISKYHKDCDQRYEPLCCKVNNPMEGKVCFGGKTKWTPKGLYGICSSEKCPNFGQNVYYSNCKGLYCCSKESLPCKGSNGEGYCTRYECNKGSIDNVDPHDCEGLYCCKR